MKVLLPVDGSDCANETLDWAAHLFNPRETDYALLYVIPVLPDLNSVEFDIMDATAMLRRTKETLEQQGCRVVFTDYALGDAVEQICQAADDLAVDQVVIGSHGRTGLNKLLMGSVSTKVLERCSRPVTVHRNVQPTAMNPADPPDRLIR